MPINTRSSSDQLKVVFPDFYVRTGSLLSYVLAKVKSVFSIIYKPFHVLIMVPFSPLHSVVYGLLEAQLGNSSRHYVIKSSIDVSPNSTSSSFRSWHCHLPSQPFGLSDRPGSEIVNNCAQ